MEERQIPVAAAVRVPAAAQAILEVHLRQIRPEAAAIAAVVLSQVEAEVEVLLAAAQEAV